ncbi:ADP-ribosylglycohydrolase family protein [Crossiella sp. CA-258035]|uniref:ADP-ribosylglycohydrolase family protein n=1 Tax=Crossiella sp. CA-258035 TaxID=2981138 RepID=UPI0024BCF3DE|nr:ADP-ribosylglycohydrolase family protein [Crossiella sp. CA-258035]WHT23670.1 ADP-ribosylglycohydrolase family protein [Crossiella sp. CA-258035]
MHPWVGRARGALAGLALGDALGMPTQAMSPAAIAENYGRITGLVDAVAAQPIAPSMPAGSVTDDTEQALLLARLLIEGRGRVDPREFGEALLAWEEVMIRRGSADLLGPSTKLALQRLARGEPPTETGRDGTTNGAAMRVAPVGIAVPPDDLERLADAVAETAVVTHGTSTGLAAAVAVAATVSAGVAGASLSEALDLGERGAEAGARRGRWVAGGEIAARIRWARGWVRGIAEEDLATAIGTVIGTSVAAQESVVAAFALAEALGERPPAALLLAANLGGDTDTVAAICGALLGACHGSEALPADLVARVLRVNALTLDPLVHGLLALRGRA